MEHEQLEKKIESVLFWKAEPIEVTELAHILKSTDASVTAALESLSQKMQGRGVTVIVHDGRATMVTAPDTAPLIEQLQKEELTKDLSRAALETLSIVLYRGPMKRTDIDYIRGVNSQFILRMLLIRGLIEKKQDPHDERAYIYTASTNTLAHLGIQRIQDLPQYAEVNKDIDGFLQTQEPVTTPTTNHVGETETK